MQDENLNQFQLVCPVFGVTTPISSCFQLREIVWRGEGPPVRQGCQACMEAGKCPINAITWEIARTKTNPYYSTTPKAGQLADRHVAAIARVKVPEYITKKYRLSDKEQALIEKANKLAAEGAIARPVGGQSISPVIRTTKSKPAVSSDTFDAAASGDMTAAINMVMEKEASARD